jgi:hypothetical protein
MRFQAVWLLFVFALSPAAAEPVAHLGREIRGEVVDEETGAPLEGVVIVARWEWLEFRSSVHGTSYRNEGNALHVAEAVTGRDGKFVLAAWGPKERASGRLDDHYDPKLSVFKSGYVALELRNRSLKSETLKLRKSAASPRESAGQIQRFQHGLWWQHESDHWKSMPRMILALHREKRHLGEDGRSILGADTLYGRSGRGELRDAQTNKAVQNAVIQVAWTLRQEGGTQARRFVDQRRSGVEGDSAGFYVSPWRLPGPQAPGWEVAYDAPPLVRVYAPGYRKSADARWDEKGGTILLEKVPDTKDAVLGELRAWREDAQAALAAAADRREALAGQQHLLRHLSDQCRTLTVDARDGICLRPDSDVERYVEQLRPAAAVVHGAAARQAGSSFGIGIAVPPSSAPRPRSAVGGFSIEPVK